MRKQVSLTKGPKPTFYKGVYFLSLQYVEEEFYKYEDLPSGAVLVAKKGSVFYEIDADRQIDLEWAEFFYASPPDDWEDSYDDYVYEYDLPTYVGLALHGEAVRLITARTRRRILVVSEYAWHRWWEEVKQYLLEHGYATTEPPSMREVKISLGGDPEFEVIFDGEVVPADSLSIFMDGDLYEPIGTDGVRSIAELRPEAAYSPEEYVEN
ncbi:MAG: hypothetical protein JHC25_03790, partial [Thermodesulfobacterium sp.]|nr:hypothetical protein [Thermodesulfobacterium sp.]